MTENFYDPLITSQHVNYYSMTRGVTGRGNLVLGRFGVQCILQSALFLSTVCHHFKMCDKDCGDPAAKSRKISSALDQLKRYTTVVADTGDFEGTSLRIRQYMAARLINLSFSIRCDGRHWQRSVNNIRESEGMDGDESVCVNGWPSCRRVAPPEIR